MTDPRIAPESPRLRMTSETARRVEALLPDLQRVARRLAPTKDAADDLVQQTLLEVWSLCADPSRPTGGDLRGLAFALLRHKAEAANRRARPASAANPAKSPIKRVSIPPAMPGRPTDDATPGENGSIPPDPAPLAAYGQTPVPSGRPEASAPRRTSLWRRFGRLAKTGPAN